MINVYRLYATLTKGSNGSSITSNNEQENDLSPTGGLLSSNPTGTPSGGGSGMATTPTLHHFYHPFFRGSSATPSSPWSPGGAGDGATTFLTTALTDFMGSATSPSSTLGGGFNATHWSANGTTSHLSDNLPLDTSSSSPLDDDTVNHVARNWASLALISLVLIGGLGNVLVTLAICLEKRLQNAINWFIMSLAAADLLVCVMVMPFGIILEFYGE